ncbi:MAG: class I SAM-dependent methyltransferase [Pseudomonadota bacterium]|nr:class I SAM-dependent methyltransferase [Pseudomonadota bacterium]
MSLIDDIDRVAIQPFAQQAFDCYQEYLSQDRGDDNPLNFDDFLRAEVLRQGRTFCNTPFLAGMYTYTYMVQHMRAFQAAINPTSSYFSELENTLFVDFGCGPGTVALALREAFPNRPLNYTGLDLCDSMLDVASNLLGATRLQGEVELRNGFDITRVVFVFSYVFSQENIINAFDYFIDTMAGCLKDLDLISSAVLATNMQFGGDFDLFIDELKARDMCNLDKSGYGNYYMKSDSYGFTAFREMDIQQRVTIGGRTVYSKQFQVWLP